MEMVLLIEGMGCQHCVDHVESVLKQVTGVRSVQVDLARKKATVAADQTVSTAQLKNAVENWGYEVTVIEG
jgi:copper ion binding protein